MIIVPDPDQKLQINLYETDSTPAPTGITITIYMDYPLIFEVNAGSVVMFDGDGQKVLWHRGQT